MSTFEARGGGRAWSGVAPGPARVAVLLALAAGAAGGLLLGAATAGTAETELVRLLRAMAMLKLLFVAAALIATLWRMQVPTPLPRLAGYAAACAAMAAGPGLIWFLSHLGPASILLHGGLVAALVLLWSDPAVSALLRRAVARRRARH